MKEKQLWLNTINHHYIISWKIISVSLVWVQMPRIPFHLNLITPRLYFFSKATYAASLEQGKKRVKRVLNNFKWARRVNASAEIRLSVRLYFMGVSNLKINQEPMTFNIQTVGFNQIKRKTKKWVSTFILALWLVSFRRELQLISWFGHDIFSHLVFCEEALYKTMYIKLFESSFTPIYFSVAICVMRK